MSKNIMNETIARKAGRPKGSKNKLSTFIESNGKDNTSPKAIPTTLQQIWGDNGTSRYGTLNPKEYEQQINSMSRADLFSHSAKLSVTPTDNLVALKKKLMTEFYKHTVKFTPQSQAATGVCNKGPRKTLPSGLTVQQILDGTE